MSSAVLPPKSYNPLPTGPDAGQQREGEQQGEGRESSVVLPLETHEPLPKGPKQVLHKKISGEYEWEERSRLMVRAKSKNLSQEDIYLVNYFLAASQHLYDRTSGGDWESRKVYNDAFPE